MWVRAGSESMETRNALSRADSFSSRDGRMPGTNMKGCLVVTPNRLVLLNPFWGWSDLVRLIEKGDDQDDEFWNVRRG